MKKSSKKLSLATFVAIFICLAIVVSGVLVVKKTFPSLFGSENAKTSENKNTEEPKSDVKEKEFTDKHLIKLEQLLDSSEDKKEAPKYTTKQAINEVLNNDESISKTSQKLGVPKSFIQAILLKEISTTDEFDKLADDQVEAYFKEGSSSKDDSSTGLGQVFAKTYIGCHDDMIAKGMIQGDTILSDNVEARKKVWYDLKDNKEFNINAVGEVILANAYYKGLSKSIKKLNDDQKSKIFAAYNGSGVEAEKYGKATLSYQKEFAAYNGEK